MQHKSTFVYKQSQVMENRGGPESHLTGPMDQYIITPLSSHKFFFSSVNNPIFSHVDIYTIICRQIPYSLNLGARSFRRVYKNVLMVLRRTI